MKQMTSRMVMESTLRNIMPILNGFDRSLSDKVPSAFSDVAAVPRVRSSNDRRSTQTQASLNVSVVAEKRIVESLKELVIVHAHAVNNLREELKKCQKENLKLSQENLTLKARLQRSSRRSTLDGCCSHQQCGSGHGLTSACSPSLSIPGDVNCLNCGHCISSVPAHSDYNPKSCKRKLLPDGDSSSSKSKARKRVTSPSSDASVATSRGTSEDSVDHTCTPKCKRKSHLHSTNGISQRKKLLQEAPSTSEMSRIASLSDEESIIQSEAEPIICYSFIPIPGLAERAKKKPEQPRISLPQWHIVSVPSLAHTLDGTEHMEDETFAKRHQKQEIEEKRIIRWDAQRRREEQKRREMQQSPRYSAYLGLSRTQSCSSLAGMVNQKGNYCEACSRSASYPNHQNIKAVEVRKSLPSHMQTYTVHLPSPDESEDVPELSKKSLTLA